MSLISLVVSTGISINKIFFNNSLLVSFQAILLVIQIFLTGLILTSMGILGLYVNKILNNSNNRPSYIIEKRTD